MRILVALGGNALLKRGEPLEAATQRTNIATAAKALAPIAKKHQLILTHGNGPQVGLLALQSASYAAVSPYPLDILGAQTEGMIGYVLEQEMINAVPAIHIATLLTQVEVDPNDPAFAAPSKPVGPIYSEAEARELAAHHGWAIAADGAHWRRVVPSPAPKRILEIRTIRILLENSCAVICGGGGGIPVVCDTIGQLHGVEAVIDKDASSACLALELDADMFIMLTDVPNVFADFGTPKARGIKQATPSALKKYSFANGSMAPKINAAIAGTGRNRKVVIGALHEVSEILAGRAGTWIVPDGEEPNIIFY